jgi:cell shape-determining protein MreC
MLLCVSIQLYVFADTLLFTGDNVVFYCAQTLDSVVSAAAVRAKNVAHSTTTGTDATSKSTPFTQERAALQAQLYAARQSKHELQQTVTRLGTEVLQPVTLSAFK